MPDGSGLICGVLVAVPRPVLPLWFLAEKRLPPVPPVSPPAPLALLPVARLIQRSTRRSGLHLATVRGGSTLQSPKAAPAAVAAAARRRRRHLDLWRRLVVRGRHLGVACVLPLEGGAHAPDVARCRSMDRVALLCCSCVSAAIPAGESASGSRRLLAGHEAGCCSRFGAICAPVIALLPQTASNAWDRNPYLHFAGCCCTARSVQPTRAQDAASNRPAQRCRPTLFKLQLKQQAAADAAGRALSPLSRPGTRLKDAREVCK